MSRRVTIFAAMLFFCMLAQGIQPYWRPNRAQAADFQAVYDVGPGKPYADPSQVPWESLAPGSLVNIYYRPQPYADKWVIAVAGTPQAPVVVRGIADNGHLPVITGENAVTRQQLDYWNEDRSVIKIGGSSHPSEFPSYITIENLDIRSARPAYTFTDDHGSLQTYRQNAAAIHIETGSHITIRNCELHDCGNGLFSGSQSSDILVESCYVHANGIENSIYHHNSYTESLGITFQYNHYGPLRDGCLGNNLKDRSAGTVVRFNWIEAGNRTLDLVESDHAELYNDPSYSQTYVYGNILIKHDVQENGQVLHYGGDGGDTSRYRKGTLYFYGNTVVSYRSGNTTLLGLSTNDEHVQAFDNIIYTTADGSHLAVMGEKGGVTLDHNWLKQGWKAVHGTLQGSLDAADNITGSDPGFADFGAQDFRLAATSTCIDAGRAVPAGLLPDNGLYQEYRRHQDHDPRVTVARMDMGAHEWRAVVLGDVNNDGTLDLADIILSLQVLSEIASPSIDPRADVNGDAKIGLAEAVYGLQQAAGLR